LSIDSTFLPKVKSIDTVHAGLHLFSGLGCLARICGTIADGQAQNELEDFVPTVQQGRQTAAY